MSGEIYSVCPGSLKPEVRGGPPRADEAGGTYGKCIESLCLEGAAGQFSRKGTPADVAQADEEDGIGRGRLR